MSVNVMVELAALKQTPLPGLKARYMEAFGEPTRSNHRQYLIKRILWRLQANEQGDLPERARRRAAELANDADLRFRAPAGFLDRVAADAPVVVGVLGSTRKPAALMPGSLLRREYKGRTICVRVLEKGFEYQGAVYRSLSAVAKAVSGAHWSGAHFFGLRSRERAA